MQDNMTIKIATQDDLPGILKLYMHLEETNAVTLSLSQAKIAFKKISSYPNYCIYVAFKNDLMVGTFSLLMMDMIVHNGATMGIIEAVVVDPEFQGQGIGKGMMRFALEESKKQNCCKIMLSSHLKRKNAHEFYKSLGFKQHGFSFSIDVDHN